MYPEGYQKKRDKWVNIRVNWTQELTYKLWYLTREEPINWKRVAQQMKLRETDCKYRYGLTKDNSWTPEEEDLLREWWEYNDKNPKLDFKPLEEQLKRHNLLNIKAKLHWMTKHGIYRVQYDMGGGK